MTQGVVFAASGQERTHGLPELERRLSHLHHAYDPEGSVANGERMAAIVNACSDTNMAWALIPGSSDIVRTMDAALQSLSARAEALKAALRLLSEKTEPGTCEPSPEYQAYLKAWHGLDTFNPSEASGSPKSLAQMLTLLNEAIDEVVARGHATPLARQELAAVAREEFGDVTSGISARNRRILACLIDCVAASRT